MSVSKLSRLMALTVTTALVSAPSFAAEQSKVTGLQVLVALGQARDVTLATETRTAILRTPIQFLKSPAAATLAQQLRISPDVLSQLVKSGGLPVSTLLATQAVAQALTGQELLDAAVQDLLAKYPSLKVVDVPSLSSVITDPNLLNQVNSVANTALVPVTPVGGGK